jgi:tRNA(fMet)-specific endonuclease VapC
VTRYLLDTNAVSDLMKRPKGPVAGHLARVGHRNCCISIIVSAEWAFGEEQRKDTRLSKRLELLRARIAIVGFEQPADWHYGRLRLVLKSEGQLIGSNDLFIAAHALALGATLVTDNIREFSRVPDLPIENWQRH